MGLFGAVGALYLADQVINKPRRPVKRTKKKFVNTTITKGSREVNISNQNTAGVFESRLYVNRGQTATLTHASHKTLTGAIKWANRILSR